MGCLPHIGVFLQDLIFIEESSKKKVAMDAFNGNKMLNFVKCVRIADRIKNLLQFRQHKYSENMLTENKRLQGMVLSEFEKLKDVTEDQLWNMSTEVVKQDAKKETFAFFHS